MSILKQGRNDLCACGSGKKYKQCCMVGRGDKVPIAISRTAILNALKMAISYFGEGRFQDAVLICQRILQADPNHQEALNLIGVLAYYAGDNNRAINLLGRALSLNPQYAEAHNNIAEVFRACGQTQSAISHLQSALKVKPNYVDALVNYGNVLQDINEYDFALDQYNQVLKIDSSHKGALSNQANLLQQLNRHAEAINVYQELLALDEDYDWALGGLVYSKLNCCDWKGLSESIRKIISKLDDGKSVIKPFDFLAISSEVKLQLMCAKHFATYQHPSRFTNNEKKMINVDKIRVAYISADFRQHPVSQLLVEVIEMHDRNRFEIVGISFGADDGSAIRARLIRAFDQFHDVGAFSDLNVANLLQSLQVDIAIDLMGYTAGSRMGIFSHHSVPIQSAFLGYPGTTGTDYMDYIISDKVVIPANDSEWFSEKVVYLPNTFFPHDSKTLIPSNGAKRSDEGLPDNAFVFCCFNNNYKINPEIFDVWMRILNQTKGSVLWLSRANELVKANLIREAELRGVSRERLIFAQRKERLEDHLARHQLADLFLDTLPYNAHTTTSDSLWAGLPVLTCLGSTFSGRVAASLLYAIGLNELVVNSLDEYESLAIRLVNEPEYLSNIKLRLLTNRDRLPIFDNKQYTENLEKAFVGMVEYYLN